ncbi:MULTISPECIES: trans-sulfuration enzyme family protein [unclassified Janthinobacterium]|uniref:trans-sulfuration enzyme family protein n=1 Tax=unclassified Janthinobacterium TaxID=2610881 RepID=UPI00034AF23F|nr:MULTISPECIES: PLP-dependent aspartate aminotransferase family protein [unclassified Janthinobacterium]MEC5160471.1 cystathionine beta-lyase [Janthinobacterium sp. CG_S6]
MLKPATQLAQPAPAAPAGYAALSQGVFHASTILYPSVAAFLNRDARQHYAYGQDGTPTQHALAAKLAELEGGGETVLVPTGLAAIVLVNSSVLKTGDQVLLPEAVYGGNLEATRTLFGKWGVEYALYGNDFEAQLRPNTRLVWIESPGSNSMLMQDVPALARAARARGVLVAMDNTWATPLGLRPLDVGVDFSVQALTKYVGGHSDLLMGAVTTRDRGQAALLRDTCELLGYYVAPDECFLALRGLPTLALRLERHFASALRIARWLDGHDAVAQVNYPPLDSDPGHALWRRDYKLGNGLLSFTLKDGDMAAVERFVGRLALFRLGNSWGGVHSLVAVAPAGAGTDGGWLLRLHVGVEDADDLLADLERALQP